MGHSVHTIRLAGGHPVLDFLNTVDPGRIGAERDVLGSFEKDVDWALRVKVLTRGEAQRLAELAGMSPVEAADSHLQLLRVRDTIRAVVASEVEEASLDVADRENFAGLVSDATAQRQFTQIKGCFAWRWAPGDLGSITHRLVFAATELLTDTSRRAIKVCAAETCGWFFLDTSRSGRRRWCSDASCGSQARVRRLRQRRNG